ncbi:hypothetical protein E2C01_000246 [Portunus trituberculatus]|uniref:Uncharacterized protein n=1 Tax=Portunus trituberculatus TaxID=210409 RepID=A0A5B7CEQ0_PORTR|nr:hypothetical protein [Portunus trituberculatus]
MANFQGLQSDCLWVGNSLQEFQVVWVLVNSATASILLLTADPLRYLLEWGKLYHGWELVACKLTSKENRQLEMQKGACEPW